jgi:raffinose/stachyose/melibiose transport system substrate-binding protein
MTHQHQTRWRRSRLAAVAGSVALAGLALTPAVAQPTNAARVGRSAAAPATVTIWDIQTGNEQKNLNAFAASFNKAHPTIRLQYQWYQNDPYKTKLAIAVGAHRGPDIFMGWGGGILQSYVKSGAVADLTSAFKTDPSWRNRYLPVVMKPVTFNGHIYGVPYENTQPEVIIYNKAIFARYHLSVPRTWPQLQQIIKTLQSLNVIPFALAGKSEWPEMMIIQYLADRIGGPSALDNISFRKLGASFDTPVWIKALTIAQQLVKENAFQSGFPSFNYDTGDASQILYGGRAAMMFMGVWQFGLAKSQAPSFLTDMSFFPVPTIPGGKGTLNDLVGNPTNFYSVSSYSKNKAAAIEYLKEQLNPTRVKEILALGEVPPVANLDLKSVGDPAVKAQAALVRNASSFQLSLDQQLPPQLAQDFLTLTGQLFTQSVTPQKFASQMQADTRAYFASHH